MIKVESHYTVTNEFETDVEEHIQEQVHMDADFKLTCDINSAVAKLRVTKPDPDIPNATRYSVEFMIMSEADIDKLFDKMREVMKIQQDTLAYRVLQEFFNRSQ